MGFIYIYIYNITFLTIFSIKLHFTPLIILLIFLETKKNSSIDKIKPKLHPKQTPYKKKKVKADSN